MAAIHNTLSEKGTFKDWLEDQEALKEFIEWGNKLDLLEQHVLQYLTERSRFFTGKDHALLVFNCF